MNVILDVNVVLDLLLRRKKYFVDQEDCFQVLLERGIPLYFPVCALPTLAYVHLMELKRLKKLGAIDSAEELKEVSRKQLSALFDEINICTSLAAHWKKIPDEHPDREDALISQSASILPGDTVIWTEDKEFKPVGEILAVGDHKTVQEALVKRHEGTQFIDLTAQQRVIRPKLELGLYSVLRHGKYIMGPEVGELEKRLAEYVGVTHCIGCASGTDALLMALMAKGVGPGDAIFTTPFTFIATAEVIALLGATPVFVDIAPKTFNIDPEKLELAVQAMKSNDSSIYPLTSDHRLPTSGLTPKGIVTVDLFGLPCDYERINKIAQEHGLFVIEDAAQGLGGEYHGKKACALSEIGCASFFPAKPLGCYGDAGAVFTDDDGQAETMRSIRVHGKGTHKYDNARIGLNARMDTLQAAILLAKFDIFPEEIELRQKVMQRYTERLSPYAALYTPYVPDGYKSAWAQYSVLAESQEMKAAFQGKLKENGIPTAVYYPKPLHLQSAFSYLGYRPGDFPVSEDCSRRIFSLPMHPYLAEKDIERICDILKKT